MEKNKSIFRFLLLSRVLLISCSLLTIWGIPSLAEVTFNPPGAQAPKRSSGGASRSNLCGFATKPTNSASVTPLLPKTNIGFTVEERPTIFIYVPPTTAKKVLFTFQEEDAKNYFQINLPLPEKPGVVGVKLPDSVPALKINKNYKWSLIIVCTEDLETDSPWVSGWVRRVQTNQSLILPGSLDSVSQLAKSGIWYDLLSTLAQLRRSQPNNQDVSHAWQDLLNNVGLNAIANEPLVNYKATKD